MVELSKKCTNMLLAPNFCCIFRTIQSRIIVSEMWQFHPPPLNYGKHIWASMKKNNHYVINDGVWVEGAFKISRIQNQGQRNYSRAWDDNQSDFSNCNIVRSKKLDTSFFGHFNFEIIQKVISHKEYRRGKTFVTSGSSVYGSLLKCCTDRRSSSRVSLVGPVCLVCSLKTSLVLKIKNT